VTESGQWSADVVEGSVDGHPCRRYAAHPDRVDAVLAQARQWNDRIFLVQGDRRVTFAAHDALVARMASSLLVRGVGRADRVAVYAANSPEWVALFFAVIAVEAIVVPCNGWWSAEELSQGIAAVEPTLVVADDQHRDRVPAGTPVVRLEDLVDGAGDGDGAADLGRILSDRSRDESDPAVILFTAGTTAFPKGAVLSHRALISNLQTLLAVSRKLPSMLPEDPAPSVTLVALPLFHIGAIQLILVPMMTGSRVVFLEGRFDAGAVLSGLAREGVTMFSGVPTMMERMLNHELMVTTDTSSVRTIVLGGSPVSTDLLERVGAAFPSARRRVGQTYGLTEAGGVVSTGVGADLERHRGSSGRVPDVVEIRIASVGDDVDGAVGTASSTGEILVRSASCMNGYWRDEGDRTIDADGWLHTGDVGWVSDDRYLYVTGRVKDLIIRGGENVSAARVESVLTAHPAVAEAAVVGVPDADLGERVAAVVVLRPDASATPDDLRAYAEQSLGRFELPDYWLLRTTPLPVNDSGKVLKRALARELQAASTP
jgi:long-chain acyl-CoA synthetase